MPKKVKRKNKKTTKIIIAIIIAILIALIVFFCLRIFTQKNNLDTQSTMSENYQKSENQQKTEVETKTKNEITIESSDTKKEDGVEVKDENNPNNSEIITGSITRASKTSDETIFRIITTTDQALSEGDCELTFSNSFQTLTSISKITVHPNSATCTFDLNPQGITLGKWDILVKIVTTNERFGIIEGSVEIKE